MQKILRGLACAFCIALILAATLGLAYIIMPYFTVAAASSRTCAADEGSLFRYLPHPFETSVARAILAGESIIITSDILAEERKITELTISQMPAGLSAAALGSSRIHQLRGEVLAVDSFRNLGVSGADIRDIVNYACQMVESGKAPDTLIIGLDPWLLNSDPDAFSGRSNTETYAAYCNMLLGGTGATASAIAQPQNELAADISARLAEIYRDLSQDTPVPLPENMDASGGLSDMKIADGSVQYGLYYTSASQDEVQQRALVEASTFMRMEGFEAVDEELAEIFNALLDYLAENGVQCVFVLSPYHPTLYDYVSEHKELYSGFFLMEDYFIALAEEKGIPIYGSYNPYVAGCDESDFYDGLHVRPEALAQIVPQVGVIRLQMATGRAASAYHLSGQRIGQETALALAEKKYHLQGEQVYKVNGTIEVQGKDCWHILRLASGAKNARTLGEYAVDKQEGVVYILQNGKWVYNFLYNHNSSTRIVP